MGLARLQQAAGEQAAALSTLDAFAGVPRRRRFVPELVERGAAVRAQLEIAFGDVLAAVQWALASGLTPDDAELPFRREMAYLALARVRIAQGRSEPGGPFLREAERLLSRLLADAAAKGRGRSVLEILVLRALAQQARHDTRGALSTLGRALALAQPDGYVHLFVDEGLPMAALLRDLTKAARRGQFAVPVAVLEYAGFLLAACRSPDGRTSTSPAAPQDTTRSSRSMAELPLPLDPLTDREAEVLQLLAQGAPNAAIADALVLSVGTVKKHVFNVCRKLGVQNRTQAVARARALHLL